MKKNTIYLIAVIILAVVAVFLLKTRTSSTFSPAKSDFAIDDTSNVTKIFMSDKNNNTLLLSRKAVNRWTVNDKYEAQRFNINMLLSTMLGLEIKAPVGKAARSNIIRDMASNSVKVEIYQWKYRINIFNWIRLFPHEKLTKVYFVGAATQDNRGTFMVMEHSDTPYIVYLPDFRGFVSSRYSPIEKYWRDYSLFKKTIPEIRAVRVEYPLSPSGSFEVRKEGRQLVISTPEGQQLPHFDTIRMMNFLNSFKNLTFEAIIDEMDVHKKDSVLHSVPFCQISLTDTANVTSSIRAYRRPVEPGTVDDKGKPLPYDLDRLYVLTNKDELTVAQYYVLDKAFRTRAFLTGDSTAVRPKK
jgi:hypothetical protein